jgi:hypothetical protein
MDADWRRFLSAITGCFLFRPLVFEKTTAIQSESMCVSHPARLAAFEGIAILR